MPESVSSVMMIFVKFFLTLILNNSNSDVFFSKHYYVFTERAQKGVFKVIVFTATYDVSHFTAQNSMHHKHYLKQSIISLPTYGAKL